MTPLRRTDAGAHRAAVLALLAAAVAGVSGCGGGDDRARARVSADDLRSSGLVLYLPDLTDLPGAIADTPGPGVVDADPSPGEGRSGRPQDERPVAVAVEDDEVVVVYRDDGGDSAGLSLTLEPAPEGQLCVAVRQLAGSRCEEGGGVLRSTMEEMATVAVVRGGTLLVLRDIVTEARPGLVEVLIARLRAADVVGAEELAAIG